VLDTGHLELQDAVPVLVKNAVNLVTLCFPFVNIRVDVALTFDGAVQQQSTWDRDVFICTRHRHTAQATID